MTLVPIVCVMNGLCVFKKACKFEPHGVGRSIHRRMADTEYTILLLDALTKLGRIHSAVARDLVTPSLHLYMMHCSH